MKRVLVSLLAIFTALFIVGCSPQSSDNDQKAQTYTVPTGWHEISIGNIATYVPDEWQYEKQVAGLDVYGISGYDTNQECGIYLSQLKWKNLTEGMTEEEVEKVFRECAEKQRDETNFVTIMDFEDVNGIWILPYHVVGDSKVTDTIYAYYNNQGYMITGFHSQNIDVDIPSAMMEVYLHPLSSD